MHIAIVPIAVEHVSGFRDTLDIVARERKYLAMLEAPTIEQTRAFVLDNIAKGNTQLVAVAEDRIVGWCDVIPKDRPIYAHGGVLGMGVHPQFRGHGLGKRLLCATIFEAWKKLNRVELTVHADNARAIALYEKAGFKKEGVMQDAVLIDGNYINVLLMAILKNSKR
jgi:RimJ/RimL family protein N-acetyltransferase